MKEKKVSLELNLEQWDMITVALRVFNHEDWKDLSKEVQGLLDAKA
jgi:hypothetical protein